MQYEVYKTNLDENYKSVSLLYKKEKIKKSKNSYKYNITIYGLFNNVSDDIKNKIRNYDNNFDFEEVIVNEIKENEDIFLLLWSFNDGDSNKSYENNIFETIFGFYNKEIALLNGKKIIDEYDFLKQNDQLYKPNLQNYFEKNNYTFLERFDSKKHKDISDYYHSYIMTDNYKFLKLNYFIFFDYFVNINSLKILNTKIIDLEKLIENNDFVKNNNIKDIIYHINNNVNISIVESFDIYNNSKYNYLETMEKIKILYENKKLKDQLYKPDKNYMKKKI